MKDFAVRVGLWLIECFGVSIARDTNERNLRFLEEALELVQSLGLSQESAHKLVDYVYNRDIGFPEQEVGGVMVTLAALCFANHLNLEACAEDELTRINLKINEIREKQKNKPHLGES